MSTFLVVGLAHRDAVLAGLERVAPTPNARAELQAKAMDAGCAEVLVLSTCSRIELHVVLDHPAGDQTASKRACWAIADRLVRALVGDTDARVARTRVAVGDDAVRHLFRVAAGLESRVVGEVEVQLQLRAAARTAKAHEGEPHRLRRVVSAAISAARRTAVEQPDVLRRGLLAERAVTCALPAAGGGPSFDAVIVGAGTMGRQVADSLSAVRCRTSLLSRTPSTGVTGGPSVHPLDELPTRLASADVLFVATSAGRRILSAELVSDILRDRPERPLTIVDLSLPRNVDPGVLAVPGVRLLDLDALGDAAVGAAPDSRALEVVEVATSGAADAYCAEIRSRRAGPVISALRTRMEETCLDQLRRTTRGTGLTEEALNRMASAVAGAMAHSPTVLARQAAADDDTTTLALLTAAFDLEEEYDVEPQRGVAG